MLLGGIAIVKEPSSDTCDSLVLWDLLRQIDVIRLTAQTRFLETFEQLADVAGRNGQQEGKRCSWPRW
jgi:hypothetical protein